MLLLVALIDALLGDGSALTGLVAAFYVCLIVLVVGLALVGWAVARRRRRRQV